MAAVSRRALSFFWSNGHPNGAYIAREIIDLTAPRRHETTMSSFTILTIGKP